MSVRRTKASCASFLSIFTSLFFWKEVKRNNRITKEHFIYNRLNEGAYSGCKNFRFLWIPLSLLRFSAECLKILLNFSSVIASHSFVEILRIPGKGVNSISFVGLENRFQGQTSWHISHPKAQFSNLPFISVGISISFKRRPFQFGAAFLFLAENTPSLKPIPFVPYLGGLFCFVLFASSRLASGFSPCEF